MWNSSNPVLANDDAFEKYYGKSAQAQANVATIKGVVNKTALLVLIAVSAGGVGYALLPTIPSVLWISAIAAFVLCIGLGFLLGGKPQLAPAMAPIFAVVEGVFLGSLTAALESALASMGATATGGLALQAFVITFAAVVGILALYAFRIIKPTRTFHAIVGTCIAGIFIAYMAMFVLQFFNITLPFLSLSSAFEGGMAAKIGLGLNAFILVIASLTLVIDFKMVEDRVAAGSPKYMEWYCGFALLVTIAWIYFEAVKLAFRIAAASRD